MHMPIWQKYSTAHFIPLVGWKGGNWWQNKRVFGTELHICHKCSGNETVIVHHQHMVHSMETRNYCKLQTHTKLNNLITTAVKHLNWTNSWLLFLSHVIVSIIHRLKPGDHVNNELSKHANFLAALYAIHFEHTDVDIFAVHCSLRRRF